MEEEGLKNFINSIIFLVKLFAGLKDKFLAQKLYDKISRFIAGYIELFNSKGEEAESASHNSDFATSKDFAKSHNIVQHKTYVAQYYTLRGLLNSLDNLLELLDYLEHSKSVSTTPLLYARRNLLDFKLNLIRLHHQLIQPAPKSKENKPIITIPQNIHPERDREGSSRTNKFVRDSQRAFVSYGIQSRNLKESSNKDKIFNFIKRSPNSRTKEIIEEFNILSERTVKRNLKELTTEGMVRKWAKDNKVYYSAV